MLNTETPEQQSRLFTENSPWLKVCLIVMFTLAALIRRDEIKAPGHLIEREYNSAIFARSFYLESNAHAEEWRKENALATREQLPLLEPPLTEYLVSLIYRIVGHEEIWYARYLTALFWLVGGFFMYKITQMLLSEDAALLAVGYYLFVPWGVIISRSFQPDSLMMMMFLISLYCILRYFERPLWPNLLLAGTLTGITLLIRPLVLFALFSAFIALSLQKRKPGTRLFDGHMIAFFMLSLAFPAAFYGYGIFLGKFLQGQADLSFRPYLLTRWEFWLGWFNNAINVVERTALICAVFGFFLLRRNNVRILIIGLAAGYVIFGTLFTFHIHSHPYYHIQLFPVIAICAAALLITVANTVIKLIGRSWWMPVTAVLLLALYFSYNDVRSMLYTTVFEDPALAWKIGEAIDHNPHTVFVAYHYGLPLEYYGEFSGLPWPVSIDDPFYRRPDARELSVQERLDALGFVPEYFVITNFDLFTRKHQDLQAYLEANCSTIVKEEAYWIYSSCNYQARQ